MDKSEIAIAIAVLSACFTGWQSYSGHVVAKLTRAAAKRKKPIFEISSHPSRNDPEWTAISVIARNFEPVSVRVTGCRYKGRGVVLLDGEAQWSKQGGKLKLTSDFPMDKASSKIELKHKIGAAGDQVQPGPLPIKPRSTIQIDLLARGKFDHRRLEILWEWADNQNR